jgi:hypothetical protein
MNIFSEKELSEYIASRRSMLKAEIHSEEPNRLLNMNSTKYVEYLTARYRIEPLSLGFGDLRVDSAEKQIRSEMFPGRGVCYGVERGQSYPKQVVTFHIPFQGGSELLRLQPSNRLHWTTDVEVTSDAVLFEVINFNDDADDVKRRADDIIGNIRRQALNVAQQVSAFNDGLGLEIQGIFDAQKAEHLKRKSLLEALGIPIKQSDSMSASFAVPIVQKKIIVKPVAPSSEYKPEPTVEFGTYEAILHVIHDFGVNMERHPSIYRGKGEEALRDLLIMQLSPHFQSVTGETFNSGGKTDILIRHERSNVFIAECKFWRGLNGKDGFFSTIAQALS